MSNMTLPNSPSGIVNFFGASLIVPSTTWSDSNASALSAVTLQVKYDDNSPENEQ